MSFKFPSLLNISKILEKKRIVITISVIISFIIWLSVTIVQNPTREQTFNDVSATISIDNTVASEMGLGIVTDLSAQKFSVTVSGPNYVVSSLRPEDIALSASVVDVNAAGTYTLDIIGSTNSSKTGYTFTSITPSTIDVTFDYFDTKEFTVEPKVIGVSATEGLVCGEATVYDTQQSTIKITGPRTTIDKINTVSALVQTSETIGTSKTYDSDLVLYDSDGNIIYRYSSDGRIIDGNDNEITSISSNLSLSFTGVKVTQLIYKKATVPCKVSFTNLPAGLSEDDISYKLNISKVTIKGTPEIVDTVNEITLAPIDFRNVSTTSNKFEISATLPNGVKFDENIGFFEIEVDVSDYSVVTLDIKNIRCIGVGSSLTAKIDSVIKNVKICGPKSVINKLKSTDLYAIADLTDKTAGEHSLDVTVQSDVYENIWQIGTYSTTVTLK